MITGLVILHVVICVLLTIVVLLQFGKGAEAGAMMGQGASQAVFTSSAKGNFFSKMTTFLAIAFMVNSIALTTLKTKESKKSLFDDEAPVAAPLNSDNEQSAQTMNNGDSNKKTETSKKSDASPKANSDSKEETEKK